MACNYKTFCTKPNKNNAWQAEFNQCFEERLYKIDPYKHFSDRTIASQVKNANTLTVYWNDVGGDEKIEKPEPELEDLTRTGLNKKIAKKLAEIEEERKAILGRKNNFFLFVMLPKFSTWDGTVPEKDDEKDIFFKWMPFKKPEPQEPFCIRPPKKEEFIVLPKCKAVRKPPTVGACGKPEPSYFECNLC